MKQRNFLKTFLTPIRWIRGHKLRLFLIPGGAAAIAVIMFSCTALNQTVNQPPNIPGATFVGSSACADCHETITRDFKTADHARLMAQGKNAENAGCESCHGPGSKHVESGGAAGTIVNPKKDPETCFQCHLDMRARFSLPHHHPVLEGKVSCANCHNPHKGSVIKGGGATNVWGRNETCFQCHTAQRGPFVFEHLALREGCAVCHNPHGSVNQRLLTERNQTLCLKCHLQQQNNAGAIYIGNQDHSSFLTRGTCWSGGCHEAVHGSQVSSSLRY